MSSSQFHALNRSDLAHCDFESFDFDGVVEFLGAEPAGSDVHHIDGISCNLKNGNSILAQNRLVEYFEAGLTSVVGGKSQQETLPEPRNDFAFDCDSADPRHQLEFSPTSVSWQSWIPTPDVLEIPDEFDVPPLQLQQSVTNSERSDESQQSDDQTFGTANMDATDLAADSSPLFAIEETLPQTGRIMDQSDSDSSKSYGQMRELISSPNDITASARRRAKNRTAASKCRAKKKNDAKALQDAYEQTSSRNTRLKTQERNLRELITSLRNYALQHDSTRCRCKSLHAFNERRAEYISQRMDGSGRISM